MAETMRLPMFALLALFALSCVSDRPTVSNTPTMPDACRTHSLPTDSDFVAPKLLSHVPFVPPYPPASGEVCLEAVVGIDGKLTDIRVIRSGGPRLDRAAVEEAATRRYTPATKAGTPVALPINIWFNVESFR
jgi:TonB family protein